MALLRGAAHWCGGAVRRSFRAAGCVRHVFRGRSARCARMRGLSGLRPARMLGVRVREGGRTLRAAQHRCVTHERVVGSWGRAVGQGRVGSGVAWSVGHAALVCYIKQTEPIIRENRGGMPTILSGGVVSSGLAMGACLRCRRCRSCTFVPGRTLERSMRLMSQGLEAHKHQLSRGTSVQYLGSPI